MSLTPTELRERRRDRDLRTQFLRHKRVQQSERLWQTIYGICQLRRDHPSLLPIWDRAEQLAFNEIESLQ